MRGLLWYWRLIAQEKQAQIILTIILHILTAEQTSARETHATIKSMSISMTTLICSCSDFASVPVIVSEMIWASPGQMPPRLSYAISFQYLGKPLTTTASSACLQPG